MLPDFSNPKTSVWFKDTLSELLNMLGDTGMPKDSIAISLIKNSPLVYVDDMSKNNSNNVASFCNTSYANIGPFVPKTEWHLTTDANYTVEHSDDEDCHFNISGVVVNLSDCSLMHLDPASRFNSSDIIGVFGTLCPSANHATNISSISSEHISSHNTYSLNQVRETRSSLDTMTEFNKAFILK